MKPLLTIDEPYRAGNVVLRDKTSKEFTPACPTKFGAVEAVPEFAARWAADAAKVFGNDRVLTGTVNASGACPIGAKALCGQYCFAHRAWSANVSPRRDVDAKYLTDAKRLQELGLEIGIFLSYDTEPFPGGIISEISAKLLRVMRDHPPAALLIHSHAAHVGHPKIAPLIRDVSQATELIVGIGFETNVDDVGRNNPHYEPVAERVAALERLAAMGVKTQASTTPLLGYRDYAGFVRNFYNAGVHRIMVGELRKEFTGGGTAKANGVHDLGLPVPT
ncbi:MAG TPA: hypothetical protein PKV72_06250, partial [Candidatus Peribacteria bacterium]|nr:hypothetical protein [Candidatus Peribacteria bacterium]